MILYRNETSLQTKKNEREREREMRNERKQKQSKTKYQQEQKTSTAMAKMFVCFAYTPFCLIVYPYAKKNDWLVIWLIRKKTN